MATAASSAFTPDLDLDLTRDALASSTLSHGLMVLGDRWTVAVLMGAFTGVQRFDDWQLRLAIPRPTLADRLKTLVALGLLRQRAYQQRPTRFAYHLTRAGLKLYDHVLMIWMWEKRCASAAPACRKNCCTAPADTTSCRCCRVRAVAGRPA